MCRITANRTVRPISFKSIEGKNEENGKEPLELQQQQEPLTEKDINAALSPDIPQSQAELQRSTICSVCKVDTKSYNLNYGSSTCLSCRAFFRRVIQKTPTKDIQKTSRTPNFICRFGGDCEISESTRRSCKRCRFDLCVRVGMNSQCVMDGEAKQVRFAKFINRRRGIDKKASTMAKLPEPGKREKRRRGRRIQNPEEKQDLLQLAVLEVMQHCLSPRENEPHSNSSVMEVADRLEMPDLLTSEDLNYWPTSATLETILSSSSDDMTESSSVNTDSLDEAFSDFFDISFLPKEGLNSPLMDTTIDIPEDSLPLFEGLLYITEQTRLSTATTDIVQ